MLSAKMAPEVPISVVKLVFKRAVLGLFFPYFLVVFIIYSFHKQIADDEIETADLWVSKATTFAQTLPQPKL